MKGMLVLDIPECCAMCRLYDDVFDECTVVDIESDDPMKRPDWCPIIERVDD